MRIDGQAAPIEFLSAAPSDKSPAAGNRPEQGQVEIKNPDVNLMPEREDVQNAVAFSNNVMKLANYHIEFQVQENTNKYQVKVVDNESGDVIREIPPDYMLKIAEQLQGKIQAEAGLLVDKIA
ncbi:MAG: flagellar protein FlaG [Syntrophomonadaceae bacterium]